MPPFQQICPTAANICYSSSIFMKFYVNIETDRLVCFATDGRTDRQTSLLQFSCSCELSIQYILYKVGDVSQSALQTSRQNNILSARV